MTVSGGRSPVAAMPTVDAAGVDAAHLRRVVGRYPTGVVALAALVADAPVGMVASSFTSVSLKPPLVSVCVAHGSATWPQLSCAPRLGLSVLSAGQARHGRQLARKGIDRFAGVHWRPTDAGAILLDGAAAWLITSIDRCVRAGDHDIVVLRVHDAGVPDADPDAGPLVFHASTFHRLAGT